MLKWHSMGLLGLAGGLALACGSSGSQPGELAPGIGGRADAGVLGVGGSQSGESDGGEGLTGEANRGGADSVPTTNAGGTAGRSDAGTELGGSSSATGGGSGIGGASVAQSLGGSGGDDVVDGTGGSDVAPASGGSAGSGMPEASGGSAGGQIVDGLGGAGGGDVGPAAGGSAGSDVPDASGGSAGGQVVDGVGGAGGGVVDECAAIPGPCTRTEYRAGVTAYITMYIYDERGLLIRTESGVEAPFTAAIYYSYDEAGQLVESWNSNCGHAIEDPYSCVRHEYAYDEQGRLVFQQDTETTSMYVTRVCTYSTYDEDDLLVDVTAYAACGDMVLSRSTYVYDDAQRLVTVQRLTGRTDYEYDANGWVSAMIMTDEDGNVTSTVRYTRNATGQELTVDHESPSRDDYRRVYTYDEQGNRLTALIMDLEGDDAGEARDCATYTYDVCGNPLTDAYSPDCSGVAESDTEWSYDCFED